MEIQILNEQYIKAVMNDELLIAKIAQATGRKISSIKRWLQNNDELLTTATVLSVIRGHLELDPGTILTETVQPA